MIKVNDGEQDENIAEEVGENHVIKMTAETAATLISAWGKPFKGPQATRDN